MCKYCDLVSGDEIDIGDSKNQTLYIERHNNNFSISTHLYNSEEEDETDINFCPKCRKKVRWLKWQLIINH